VRFSERHGLKPVKSVVQVDSMDADLRVGLWNVLDKTCWEKVNSRLFPDHQPELHSFFELLWHDHYKRPIDSMPRQWVKVRDTIRAGFFACEWNEVYDLLEAIVEFFPDKSARQKLERLSNAILKKEVAGFRFIDGIITPITSDVEIADIEKALRTGGKLKPVSLHLKRALELLADRESPDYRNSIKESISAIESVSKLLSGEEKAELSGALKVLEGKIALHGALKEGFKKLDGYTSDDQGIRHALMDEPNLDSEDAMFMLVSCSAFVNYLVAKASKAGVEF
jgi:hypothetical protein